MKRVMLKSKIHRATVTDANIDYEGSITIDEELMEEADIVEYEQVHIYNISNGNRLETYVIKGERSSGVICINGAAAKLVNRGDMIIIANYAIMEEEEAIKRKPRIVHVDENNQILDKFALQV
jgi:aspartate 1-decarboxylase